jgi:ribosomal protein L37E
MMMMKHTFEIEEGDRQCIVLALAKLSLSRPGWHPACLSRIAKMLGGGEMYDKFRSFGPDYGGVINSDPFRITCLTCGRTSYNKEDVSNLFCGHCKKFHRLALSPLGTPEPPE